MRDGQISHRVIHLGCDVLEPETCRLKISPTRARCPGVPPIRHITAGARVGAVSCAVMPRKPKEPRYTDGTKEWQCGGCSRWLARESFGKDSRTPNGLNCYCYSCIDNRRHLFEAANPDKSREYDRARYAANRDKEKRRKHALSVAHPDRFIARKKVHAAVRSGRLVKPPGCSACPEIVPSHRIHGHHSDYSKPLDVEWLCAKCHAKRHMSQ